MNIKLDEQYTINCAECGYNTKCISITPEKFEFIKIHLCEDCLKILSDALNVYYTQTVKK